MLSSKKKATTKSLACVVSEVELLHVNWHRLVNPNQIFMKSLTAQDGATPEDPQNSVDHVKICVPTPLPDNTQQWVLEDFQATEISPSWKRFLVPPEPQPEPAEAAQEVAPPTEAEDTGALAEERDLTWEEVHVETVALDSASETKESCETTEVPTAWVEGPADFDEEVTTGFTEALSEDATPADKPVLSEAALDQDVEYVATAACEFSTTETTPFVSGAPHEASGPGKIWLLFPILMI